MLMHAYMSTQVLVSKHANEQCISNALTCTICYSSNFSLGLIISKINNNFILQFYSLTIAFCFVHISAASLTPGYPLAGHLLPLWCPQATLFWTEVFSLPCSSQEEALLPQQTTLNSLGWQQQAAGRERDGGRSLTPVQRWLDLVSFPSCVNYDWS